MKHFFKGGFSYGISEKRSGESIKDTFSRADAEMYRDKSQRKLSGQGRQEHGGRPEGEKDSESVDRPPEVKPGDILTKGGDEFGFTVVGATEDQANDILDRTNPRIEKYVKDNDLGNIKHTKEDGRPGTGIYFAAKQFDKVEHKGADAWIKDADLALERVKIEGGQYEHGKQTEEAGAVSPEKQPGEAPGGNQEDAGEPEAAQKQEIDRAAVQHGSRRNIHNQGQEGPFPRYPRAGNAGLVAASETPYGSC